MPQGISYPHYFAFIDSIDFQSAEHWLSIGRASTFNRSDLKKSKMQNRFVKAKITEALADTRVVLISGPRQSEKTTLATDIAAETIPFFTLDDATVLAAANDDPVGFLRGLKRAVIDEVQRAPGLLLCIKSELDRDTCPGGSY